jgi:hypothetical protein
MADTSPKKKAAAKPKKPAAHPKYSEMVGRSTHLCLSRLELISRL